MVDTFAASYLAANSIAAGATSATAVARKSVKYAWLGSTYIFISIALETLGAMNNEALKFFVRLGRRIAVNLNDNRETSFLFQRLSVLIQRFNAVAFRALSPMTASFGLSVSVYMSRVDFVVFFNQ